MILDLAQAATYELLEKVTSKDGSSAAGAAKEVLLSHLPQGSKKERLRFVNAILRDGSLARVWNKTPLGRRTLMDSLGWKIESAVPKTSQDVVYHIPVFRGRFVIVNRGNAKKPLFHIGKVAAIVGEGVDRKAVVSFGGGEGDTPYPAFTESAIGIVGFFRPKNPISNPPAGYFEADQFPSVVDRKKWVSDGAIERWMKGKAHRDARAMALASKRWLALVDDEDAAEKEDAAALATEDEGVGSDDDWFLQLGPGARESIRLDALAPEHRDMLSLVVGTGAFVVHVEQPVAGNEMSDFQIEVFLNRLEKTFVATTEDNRVWDFFPYGGEDSGLLGEITQGVEAGTSDDVIQFIEENTL